MSEQAPQQKRRFLPTIIVGIILGALCAFSLYVRIVLPYDAIFVNNGTWVWFRETDAYYYLRHIENILHHFPHYNTFDPYQLYLGGTGAGGIARPFFAWLVAGVILIVSGGSPTPRIIEVVAAYMPAILGTLTLFPVYFIGKKLFNRWAGVISAALVIILPSEFLHRSLLGFTDHHVAEVLFSTTSMLFLIMAIKVARERDISFSHILNRDWSITRRPLMYTLLAGIFLGIYLLSWVGGLLMIFVIFAYLVIQFIVDHLTRRSTDYLSIIGTPLFLVAFLMVLPVLGAERLDIFYLISMPIAMIVPMVLSIISRFMVGKRLKPVYYPLTLLGIAGIGLAALRAANPILFANLLGLFRIFTPTGAALTISEVQPFSLEMGRFSFTTSFFISFISLAMLIYAVTRRQDADKILFLVWCILMLMAMLGQRRFSYYYTVNVALLTGYFSWKMLDIAGLDKLLTKSRIVETAKKFKKKVKKDKEKTKARIFVRPRRAWARVIVVGIILFVVVILPAAYRATVFAGLQNQVMDEGWYTSCLWLKDNTPDPFGDFGDPDFYYALYPPRDEFQYPDSVYGCLSWWDYGHFIMRLGHRIPNANPGQAGAVEAGKFFIAQNESAAQEIVERYGLRTKYVMIDYMMALPSKFYAMAEWAGNKSSNFYELYYLPSQGGGRILFYPAYYSSMVVRLYNFDGKAVSPTRPIVISYVEKEYQGQKYKEIVSGQYFSTYAEAQAFVANQTSGNYKIVGDDPFASIVPLEEVKCYKLIHSSSATVTVWGQVLPSVKIFEYIQPGQPLE